MCEFCEIEVTIKSVRARSYKVSRQGFKYTNNFQASLYDDLFTIPKSQVKEIRDLGNGRQIMVLPKWLAKKMALKS